MPDQEPRVYGFEEFDGQPFLVMELVEGFSGGLWLEAPPSLWLEAPPSRFGSAKTCSSRVRGLKTDPLRMVQARRSKPWNQRWIEFLRSSASS